MVNGNVSVLKFEEILREPNCGCVFCFEKWFVEVDALIIFMVKK
jgi:hypothetical protein